MEHCPVVVAGAGERGEVVARPGAVLVIQLHNEGPYRGIELDVGPRGVGAGVRHGGRGAADGWRARYLRVGI